MKNNYNILSFYDIKTKISGNKNFVEFKERNPFNFNILIRIHLIYYPGKKLNYFSSQFIQYL